jgi:hypothetical protein
MVALRTAPRSEERYVGILLVTCLTSCVSEHLLRSTRTQPTVGNIFLDHLGEVSHGNT